MGESTYQLVQDFWTINSITGRHYITHPHNARIFNGNPSKLPCMCIVWYPQMGHLMIPWTNRPRFFDGQIGQTWDDLEMLLLLSLRITWNNELVGWLSHWIEKYMRKLNFNYGTPKSLSKNEPSLNATQLSSDVWLFRRDSTSHPLWNKATLMWFLVLDTTSKLQMLHERWWNLHWLVLDTAHCLQILEISTS